MFFICLFFPTAADVNVRGEKTKRLTGEATRLTVKANIEGLTWEDISLDTQRSEPTYSNAMAGGYR